MIRIYQHKTRTVKAIQFYVNYGEVERFTGVDIGQNKRGHDTLAGKELNQGDFVVNDNGVFNVVSKEQFRREYEPE